ncbi:MAG: hypothetical protein ACI9MC_003004 [Kiritimatiellia bacterium]|jgi:hypothetical protein
MNFDTDDIQRITSEACAMFGLEVVNGATPKLSGEGLGCSISISGVWNGSVRMACGAEFAKRLACVMFELDPPDLAPADINDAFGELVNVTAGNIKALLPAGCSLGLPEIGTAADGVSNGPTRLQAWGFSAEGDVLTVAIKKVA